MLKVFGGCGNGLLGSGGDLIPWVEGAGNVLARCMQATFLKGKKGFLGAVCLMKVRNGHNIHSNDASRDPGRVASKTRKQ